MRPPHLRLSPAQIKIDAGRYVAAAVNYAVAITGKLDVAHNLSGVEFTRGSGRHDFLWQHVAKTER